jgi:hypothetical protein
MTWWVGSGTAQSTPEPPNAPALVYSVGGDVALRYGGDTLLAGRLSGDTAGMDLRVTTDTAQGAVTQVVKWTGLGRSRLSLDVRVFAGPDALAGEAEPKEDGLPLVRMSLGSSVNALNRAVYDRRADWLLSVDVPAHAQVTPLAGPSGRPAFRLEVSGGEITLRFRPRYYQRHRGLTQYRPWTYQVWSGSVAGWTSWYAFRDKVTEQDIRRTADVLSETLLPFGYTYLQIDDGYQQNPIGVPEHWLVANAKFPDGLSGLRRYISGKGLKPGIWTNTTFHDAAWAESHPRYFVPAADGHPAYGNWVGYVMDGANPATMAELIRPVYQGLKSQGWEYFKVDALRHLRYEGYNSYADYFRQLGKDRTLVFRGVVEDIRETIGRGVFLLACWGIRPELIGLVDAVRVGDDGFGYGAFAQYNSFNNVVWRNDPDHIELSQPDAYRATTLTSLTGSVLMLTDPPELYRTPRVAAARRASPVLFARPAQFYDVDPSRSSRLGSTATELSGSGPRPVDADQRLTVPLYLLDIAAPFEQWHVLARTGGEQARLEFADLGLQGDREYLVFEFWTEAMLGSFKGGFAPGPVDPRYQVQVFCIRARLPHPQLVATSRHVSCGAADLQELSFAGNVLAGESAVVGGDDYRIFLTEPAGYEATDVRVTGASVVSNFRSGDLRVITLRTPVGGTAQWRVTYARS